MERKRSIVLIGLESSYGIEPSSVNIPIITVGDPNFELVTNVKERNVTTKSFGTVAPTVNYKGAKLSFKTELKGAGSSSATPPVFAPILIAAGMTETIEPLEDGGSCSYTCSDIMETASLTVYYYHGATIHKMVGCVANIKMDFAAGDIMYMDVELQGLVPEDNIIADTSIPNVTYSTVKPYVYRDSSFNFGSITDLKISKLSIDMGNEIAERPDPSSTYGINRYYIKNRNIKISFDPEKELLSKFNPYALHINQTETNIVTVINEGSEGNEIGIYAKNVTIDAPKHGERDGIITYEIAGVCRIKPDVTGEPLTLEFK